MKSLLELEKDAFGNIDAVEDNLLEQCFEEHEAYENLLSFNRFLAIGKKGSGKTAIFRKIMGITQEDIFTKGYNLQDECIIRSITNDTSQIDLYISICNWLTTDGFNSHYLYAANPKTKNETQKLIAEAFDHN